MLTREANIVPTLRLLALLYILLIIVEGAFRKWLLPSLSDVFLLARDPIVLLSYFLAITHGRFPVNIYIMTLVAIVSLMVLTTALFGHADPFVTVYGVRTNLLHFPYAFLVGSVFTRSDVIQIGRWWLVATIPMTVIIALQFYSPQDAWINASPGGGKGGAGFSGALGRYRPPGTFSFINGVALFYTYSTAFLVAGLTQHHRYPKWLLMAGTCAIIIAAPISISRSLVIMCGFVLVVGIAASGLQRQTLIRYLKLSFFFLIAFFVADRIPVFNEAKEAFLVRWERSTGEDQGGISGAIGDRIIGMFTDPFERVHRIEFFGKGIGAGTQFGSSKLHDKREFSLGESEWSRVLNESGLLLGMLFLGWRMILALKLLRLSLEANVRGDGFPIILIATCGFGMLNGQIGQTTTLGFTIFGMGMLIASLRSDKLRSPRVASTNETSD